MDSQPPDNQPPQPSPPRDEPARPDDTPAIAHAEGAEPAPDADERAAAAAPPEMQSPDAYAAPPPLPPVAPPARPPVRRRRGLGLVLVLLGLAIMVSFFGLAALYFLPGAPPTVASDTVLELDLSGALVETHSTSLVPFVGGQPTVFQIVQTLKRAETDRRVRALVVKPSLVRPDWAKLQEVRDAIASFRKAGKKTAAFLEFGTEPDYFLATACEQVYLLPVANLDLRGVTTYELFLRGTLDKIGTFPDYVWVGDYKTAVNAYTEQTFTPAHREMSASLNRETYEQIAEAIADGRQKPLADVQALIDDGPFLAVDAADAGLVDDVLYEDEVWGRAEIDEEWSETAFSDYYRATTSRSFSFGPRLALIYAVGEIASGDTIDGSTILGSDTIVDLVQRAREDDSVKAVILRIDSPGGSVLASDVIWRELMLTREEKPLIVSMSDLAASGGYYIAVPGHAIVAQPRTLTGSIGVYVGKFVVKETLDKLGIGIEAVTDGRHADLESPVRPFSDDERAIVQEQIQSTYEGFLERVASARSSTPEDVHEIAQGRVWTGRQAHELGLVDEIGGLATAIRLAKERAGLDESADVPVVTFQRRLVWSDFFGQPFPGFRQAVRSAVVSWLLGPAEREAFERLTAPLARWRPLEPLALMPYVVTR